MVEQIVTLANLKTFAIKISFNSLIITAVYHIARYQAILTRLERLISISTCHTSNDMIITDYYYFFLMIMENQLRLHFF